MSKTPYNKENGKKSLVAHEHAKDKVYPLIFSLAEKIEVEHQDGNHYDMTEKIDVFANVFFPGEKFPVLHSIQERWRDVSYAKYRDITITKLNTISAKEVEFYNGGMQYFLYGYFDYEKSVFGEWVFVDFAKVRYLHGRGILGISDSNNNKGEKKQDFACFSFDQLYYHDCILKANLKNTPPNRNKVIDYWRRLYLNKCT